MTADQDAQPEPTAGDVAAVEQPADLPEIERRAQAFGVRLLVLDQQVLRAKQAYDAACREAYGDFARLRNAGIPQVAPDLGQGRAGLFSLLSGGKTTVPDEDELLLLYAVNSPGDLEDRVLPAAFGDDRVIKLLREHFPEFVEVRIKPAVRADIDKEIDRRNGWVPTPGTGELVKVAEVTPRDANGKFQLRPDARVQQMITAAIESGRITEDGQLIEPSESEEK
jgi:hypothetical protein